MECRAVLVSQCVWFQVWQQYLRGEISAEELERQTCNEQQSLAL